MGNGVGVRTGAVVSLATRTTDPGVVPGSTGRVAVRCGLEQVTLTLGLVCV